MTEIEEAEMRIEAKRRRIAAQDQPMESSGDRMRAMIERLKAAAAEKPRDERYRCPACRDTCFVTTRCLDNAGVAAPCTGADGSGCRAHPRRQLEGLPKDFVGVTLRDTGRPGTTPYAIEEGERTQEVLVEHIAAGAEILPRMGMYIYGETCGRGKSHLAACALKAWTRRHQLTGAWYEASQVISRIQRTYSGRSEENKLGIIEEVTRPDVVVLDEIGTLEGSNDKDDIWRDILERMRQPGKFLIGTGNVSPSMLRDGWPDPKNKDRWIRSPLGARGYSRLTAACQMFELRGSIDYRSQGRRG
jgi:DNA replication protein DnaC